jgi:hypothetical protein
MAIFVLWFVVLAGLVLGTKGWARGILVTLYLLGSVVVLL